MQISSKNIAESESEDKGGVGVQASERINQHLRIISERDGEVRAFVEVDEKGAREAAAQADLIPRSERNTLHGMPIAIKEIFDVAGLHCSWGSTIHKERIPTEDSDVTKKLRAAGAIVMGTVVSSEYAIADTSQTRNPWQLDHTPGASSSGSAASVAAGMVDLAIGTQTIGSTIRPASFCGVLGLKPTHDKISLKGVMPLSAPLDHVGLFSKSLEIIWNALDVLSPDVSNDRGAPNRSVIHVLEPWSDADFCASSNDAVSKAAGAFRAADLSVRSTSLPKSHDDEQMCLMDILAHDMSRHHWEDYSNSGDQMNERVRNMVVRGQEISQEIRDNRLQRGEEITAELHDILGGDGLFLTASADDVAPLSVDGTGSRTAQRIWTLAGMPAISIPAGEVNGLPIGVQLIGPKNSENRLLQTAKLLIGENA